MLNGTMHNSNFNPENSHIARYGSVFIDAIRSQDFLFGEFNMDKNGFKRKCACGCGKVANFGKKYISGHNVKGKESPAKGKDKYAEVKAKGALFCGCGCGEKTKWGRKNWNKYIIGHFAKSKNHPNYGKDKYAEDKAKGAPLCACSCKERVRWNKSKRKWNKYIHGHHGRNKITIECAYCKKSKKIHSGEKRKQNFCNCKCMGKWMSENLCGPLSSNWQGGISAEPYCDIWLDQDYKNDIRDRDNNECQNPTCRHNTDHLPLEGHHIDYDKKNCHPWNIITTCKSCNCRANFNREWWQELYQNILSEKFGYTYD